MDLQIVFPALIFLPAFVGARPYHQAYARGVKIIGATSHYVTAELDAGPIIEQDVIRISHHDSVEEMVRRGKYVENEVLAIQIMLSLDMVVIQDLITVPHSQLILLTMALVTLTIT